MSKKKYTEDYLDIDEVKVTHTIKQNNAQENFVDFLNKYKHYIAISISAIILLASLVNFIKKSSEQNIAINTVNTVVADTVSDSVDSDIIVSESTTGKATQNINQNNTQTNQDDSTNYMHNNNYDANFISSLKQYYNNDDIIMYLSIYDKNNVINLGQAVAQTVDNTYYLDHNLYRTFDKNGAVFVDYSLTFDEVPKNLVIYGNDLYEDSPLANIDFFTDKQFYDNNKSIEINLNDKILNYTIFALVETETSFNEEMISFLNDENFEFYLERIKDEATYFDEQSDIDKIITIATSSNKANSNRYILYGKLE